MSSLIAIGLAVVLYCGVTYIFYRSYTKGNAHVRASYRRHYR
jgi:hypothetical protein